MPEINAWMQGKYEIDQKKKKESKKKQESEEQNPKLDPGVVAQDYMSSASYKAGYPNPEESWAQYRARRAPEIENDDGKMTNAVKMNVMGHEFKKRRTN
eukprot:8102411-Karenia_brevis.AAC.1